MRSKAPSPDLEPVATYGNQSAPSLGALQDRLSELTRGAGPQALRPVTFRAYGAGAQRDLDTPERINFTFPVDAGKCVRISANAETAAEFCDSLVEALGGWKALQARQLKSGSRR